MVYFYGDKGQRVVEEVIYNGTFEDTFDNCGRLKYIFGEILEYT